MPPSTEAEQRRYAHRDAKARMMRTHPKGPDDPVPVTCWCECEVVLVPLAEIHAGRTASCGLAFCHPPLAA